jgi:type I restriction enzyme M protein
MGMGTQTGHYKTTVKGPLRCKGADLGRAYSPAEIKKLKERCERDENAPPVIRKIHKPNTPPDPILGRFEVVIDWQAAGRRVRAGS